MALSAGDTIEVELVFAVGHQVGDGDCTGSSIHCQCLGSTFCVLVLDQERVKTSRLDHPGQAERIWGNVRD